ncbi:MAG: pyridoxal phosphate-dependent aminotransferase [Candidatus Kariarchaeaceae archaeon]
MLQKTQVESKSANNRENNQLPVSTRVKAPNFYITPTVARISESATLATNIYVKYLRQHGDDISNFGLGESPFGAPKGLMDALGLNAHHTSYLPTQGIPELRKMITKFYRHYFDYSVDPDRVVVGPGSKELIFITMAALDAPWLFVSPSWVSYESQARILGRTTWRAYTSHTNKHRITEKVLRKKFMTIDDKLEGKTLTILINYPNNPTGTTLKKSEVQRIARFARNNEIIILSDEIYANITHQSFGSPHHSMGLEYPEGTIVTGGVSKDRSLGGWRFGVAILPENQPDLLKAFKSIGSETFTSVSAPLQHAMIYAYDCNEEVDHHIFDSTKIHELVGTFIHHGLINTGYKVPRPEGAFYLMPSLNHYKAELKEIGIHTSKDLVQKLILDYGVAVIPGTSFGLKLEDLSFRIAYIDYNGPKALVKFQKDRQKALSDPELFVREHCPSVSIGIERLGKFVSDLLS